MEATLVVALVVAAVPALVILGGLAVLGVVLAALADGTLEEDRAEPAGSLNA